MKRPAICCDINHYTKPQRLLEDRMRENKPDFPMIRDVPYMGVIWVVNEAMKLGFWNGHPEWCNLGQGQPEVGEMEGAPPRIGTVTLEPGDHAYGPVGGTLELREAVADWYNRTYRRGRRSQYTAANVSVASGGRLALMRFFSILRDGTRVLYKNPDYTAYEDYLYYVRHHCQLLELAAEEDHGFSLPPERLEAAIRERGAEVFVFSNPCNPTGEVIAGEALERYVHMARSTNCLFCADEFYSHFIYDADGNPAKGPVSAAAYVEDVERDPVLIVDGLTKNHRYPGWRAGWVVGPSHCIEMLNRAASAVDGGPSMLMQRAAMEALSTPRVDEETHALRERFAQKRRVMLNGLKALGIVPAAEPRGTFYVWAHLRNLPAPLNDADTFFHACLAEKVMTVPGRFFEIRPHRNRPEEESYRQWARFSYGPPESVVRTGLERMGALLANIGRKG